MNRIDRLTAMILMLQSQRVLTAEKIATHFEISVRTVYRDMLALGEAGVPIAAEAGVGYSLMRGYNVPPIMFTEEEAAALFMSGEITEQFGDESLKKSLSGALLKVRAALPDGHKSYLSRLGDSVEVWHRPNGFQKEKSLMPIQEAVVRRRCLEIEYDAGGLGKISKRTVEPLGLIFYGRQWHLISWCRMRGAIRDFRLDRVLSWEVLSESYSGHEDFSLADFFEELGEGRVLVGLKIECERWILEKVLHEMPCQVIGHVELADGRFQVEAQSCSLEWLAKWLVGLSTSVRVVEPIELRSLVVEEAQKIIQNYE